jgi:hypothetical protein
LPVARATYPSRLDGSDVELGVFAHRTIAKGFERSAQQVELDSSELTDTHVQLVHASSFVRSSLAFDALDQ